MKFILSFLVVVFLAGCNTAMLMPQQTAPTQKDITISSTDVDFSLSKSTNSVLKKSGITIGLEPLNSDPEPYYKMTFREKLQIIVMNGKQSYEVTHTPFFKQNDDRVAFRLKISNNSDRVVRSKGAIVSIDVDGKNTTLPSAAYKELTGLILVPNSTKEIVVYGPSTSSIRGDKGVMRVGIYEIGVGDKYANFEWYIDYDSQTVSKVLPLKVESVSMDPNAARRKHGSVYPAS